MIKSASIFAIILLYTSTALSGMQAPRRVVAAGGGSATITRLGFQEFSAVSGESTPTLAITIPAGTTAIILSVHSYGFYGGSPLISASIGAQNFVVDANIDPANDSGVGIGHLFSPASTGAQNLSVTVSGHSYDGNFYVAYYSGTATDGLRDSDAIGGTSLTLTTVSGDMVVSAATDADNTSITWTNATEIDESAMVAGYGVAIAQTAADGTSEAVSVGGSNSGMAAIVLKPGS